MSTNKAKQYNKRIMVIVVDKKIAGCLSIFNLLTIPVARMLVMIFAIEFLTNFCDADYCIREYRRMNYFKLKTCHRSDLPQVGLKSVESLQECIRFARERNALAFNFSPPEVSENKNQENSYITNCQIIGCPELSNSTTLVADEKFDYYSAFGNMNSTTNATCITSTGIFAVMQDKDTYVKSIVDCQKIGADLADVLSETRTKQLANLVNGSVSSWYKASFVGLDDLHNPGHFESSNGHQLHCTQYRAWGPGHPKANRKTENCVTLHADRTWRVVPCNTKLTAVCEFFPEAPTVDEFDERYLCDNISSKRRKRKCLAEKKSFRKLVERSSRRDKCALLNYKEAESQKLIV